MVAGIRPFATPARQRDAVSKDSITLKSDDGFSRTYTVAAETLVNSARDGIDRSRPAARECDRRGGEQHRDRDVHQRRARAGRGPARSGGSSTVRAEATPRGRGRLTGIARNLQGSQGYWRHTVSMSPHLLVVDDDRTSSSYCRESAFRRVRVTTATHGAEALRKAPDVEPTWSYST